MLYNLKRCTFYFSTSHKLSTTPGTRALTPSRPLHAAVRRREHVRSLTSRGGGWEGFVWGWLGGFCVGVGGRVLCGDV